MGRKYTCLHALLLVAACTALAASQSASCPDLTADDIDTTGAAAALMQSVISSCANDTVLSTGTCTSCHCALVRALAPRLQQQGQILASEMYTATAVTTLTGTISNCSRDFALQLLEHSDVKLSQLLAFDSCAADSRVIAQCFSQTMANAATADSNTTNSAATVPVMEAASPRRNAIDASNSSDADGSLTLWDEMIRDAGCALAASANDSDSINSCADGLGPAAASSNSLLNMFRMSTSPQTTGSAQAGMLYGGQSGDNALRISSKTSRGPVAWRAGCWCDDSYDPVCDPTTRKQYPSPCSAKCQYVKQTVPCSTLRPLAQPYIISSATGTPSSVYVVDIALVNTPSSDQLATAAAFAGPIPPEVPAEDDKDTQMFYYYYDDDLDDTKDTFNIKASFAKAMMAEGYGDAAAVATAVNTVLPSALQAGVTAVTEQAVQQMDGPDGNATVGVTNGTNPVLSRRWGLLDTLQNMTNPITVLAERVDNIRNRTTTAAVSMLQPRAVRNTTFTVASLQPATPSWLDTGSPNDTAAVYARDATRTSRILSALMAAARQQGDTQQAAQVAVQIGPGIGEVLNHAQQVATQRESQAPTGVLTDNLFRSNANGTGGFAQAFDSFREAMNGTNSTSALGQTMDNLSNALNTSSWNMSGIASALNTTGLMANASRWQRPLGVPVGPNNATARPGETSISAFAELVDRLSNMTGSLPAAPAPSANGLLYRNGSNSTVSNSNSTSGNSTVNSDDRFRAANFTATNSTDKQVAAFGAKQKKQRNRFLML